ncbi:DUF397 domain-containing protein [Streptomyces roseus]|uniref:Toxin n=1 Tax=Streptomyces roseus TaxID=66430 RepID=A0A0J6XPL4_9ACTN|nr:DUF397 domain-containing protein [Streptomyces roseus]KMO97169.1 toxin [Streptomyces roseus]
MSSTELIWFKSSYSDDEGSNCVEVALDWHKSTYSDGEGSACVEVATCAHAVHVRDSKLGGDGPTFAVPAGAWQAFLSQVS